MAWTVLAILAGLGALLWHMRLPRARRLELSALAFLGPMPAPRRRAMRLSLRAPLGSARFWLRALLMGLGLAALIGPGASLPPSDRAAIGLRLVVDTSGSMSTGQRMQAARELAQDTLDRARQAAGAGPFCATLSDGTRMVRAESGAIAALTARPGGLPTIDLVRAALAEDAACPATDAVVISDQPAPLLPEAPPQLAWLTVGSPEANTGIASIRHLPATAEIEVSIVRSGNTAPTLLSVRGPGGRIEAPVPDSGRLRLAQQGAGTHRLTLSPGGAYANDDRAVVTVPPARDLRIDWRLADTQPPSGFVTASGADIAIVAPLDALSPDDLRRPVLALAGGWGAGKPIATFRRPHPLLRAINLDVLEQAGPTGPGRLPSGFRPVVSGFEGAWVAARVSPPGVVLPPPLDGTSPEAAVSKLLFANALRLVLEPRARDLPFVWTAPDGTPVALAGLESATAAHAGDPAGDAPPLPSFAPRPSGTEAPLWPWLLAAAAMLLAIERAVGPRWSRGTA